LPRLRQQREREEQRQRDQVIAEFGGDMHAMAAEMVRLRRGLAQVAEAIDWMKRGAPFAMLPPGPHWKPKSEQADGHGR